MGEFDEAVHPREETGKFTEAGGGAHTHLASNAAHSATKAAHASHKGTNEEQVKAHTAAVERHNAAASAHLTAAAKETDPVKSNDHLAKRALHMKLAHEHEQRAAVATAKATIDKEHAEHEAKAKGAEHGADAFVAKHAPKEGAHEAAHGAAGHEAHGKPDSGHQDAPGHADHAGKAKDAHAGGHDAHGAGKPEHGEHGKPERGKGERKGVAAWVAHKLEGAKEKVEKGGEKVRELMEKALRPGGLAGAATDVVEGALGTLGHAVGGGGGDTHEAMERGKERAQKEWTDQAKGEEHH